MCKKQNLIFKWRYRIFTRNMLGYICAILLVFLGEPYCWTSVQATPSTFYVSPNGDDSNPGTVSAPWRTISHAASSSDVQPGDTVYIRDGVYDEYIQQKRSGAPGNLITYKSYPGETAVITGSGSWRWHILEHSYVRIEGITFRDYQKGGIQIRTRNASITGIEIINCTFENQSQLNNDGAKTIHVTTAETNHQLSDITIQGNVLLNVDTGDHPAIQVAGGAHQVRLLDNVITGTSSIGIGIAGRPDIGQPYTILIKGNEISGHGAPGKTSAGIYLDGAGEEIVVEENIIHDGMQGIKVSLESAASELTAHHIIVRRNVLYNNTQINLKLGVGVTEDNCNQTGKLEESAAVHNTIFTNIGDVTNHRFNCGENLRWKNNIFADASDGTSFHYKLGDNDTVLSSTWRIDYNLFYNQTGNGQFRWQGITYDSLAAYKAVSGQDSNSLVGDPKFVNLDGWDFQIEPDSAARDAGGPLTLTSSAGSGTVITVEEAWYFSDGSGLQDGDRIRVGNNKTVTVVEVDYGNQALTVDQSISWQNQEAVSYDYADAAPDIGAFESASSLNLIGIPGDKVIYLFWEVNGALPKTAVWRIEYDGPQGNPTSPIGGLANGTRQITVTELTNYIMYNVTLNALENGVPILTDTIKVMPTDIFIHLPIVMKNSGY